MLKNKLLFALVLTVNFGFANDLDFKKGFDMAVKAIELEYVNGSNTNRAMNYNYPKLVYLDTKDMDTNEILLTQYVAFTNGFLDTIFANEKMYFGSYLREADRKLAKTKLEKLFNRGIKEETNDNKIKYATPILNRQFYVIKRNVVEGSIKRSEYSDWSYKEGKKDELTEKKHLNLAQTDKNFFIPLENKTDAFYVEDKNISQGVYVNSADVRKMGFVNMNKFKYGRTIIDEKNNRYVKAHNENIYLKEKDIKFLER